MRDQSDFIQLYVVCNINVKLPNKVEFKALETQVNVMRFSSRNIFSSSKHNEATISLFIIHYWVVFHYLQINSDFIVI